MRYTTTCQESVAREVQLCNTLWRIGFAADNYEKLDQSLAEEGRKREILQRGLGSNGNLEQPAKLLAGGVHAGF